MTPIYISLKFDMAAEWDSDAFWKGQDFQTSTRSAFILTGVEATQSH